MWQDHENENKTPMVIRGELKLKFNTEEDIFRENEIHLIQ